MAHLVVHDTTEQHEQQLSVSNQVHVGARQASEADTQTAHACAALELVTIVSDAVSIEQAATLLVNRLKEYLAADGVALGLRQANGRCRLAAISGTAQINTGSELSRAIEAAVAEATDELMPGQSAQDTLASMLQGVELLRGTLTTRSGQTTGAIVVWRGGSKSKGKHGERFLRIAGEPLAGAFLLQQRGRPRTLSRILHGARGTRRWVLCAVAAASVLGLLFAIPYRIACDCAAEPLTRRFVSAPFAGVFEKSLVRPGDSVAKDALLGEMNGRELRIELAAITADYEQARKSHDMNLAGGKVAAAQIDRLELERLDQQRALVEHRMAHLQIKSPVAGYVIGGDLKRTEGAPLTVGQVLYEIAPLNQMIVELAIADDDIAQVQIGQTVSVRFDAHAGQTFAGRLVRIHPRSETRDSRNVFIGEVALDDAAVALRPGMRGQARITIAGQSLAETLGMRCWYAAATFVGF